jgi:anti-anti-sigma factor
MLTLDGDMTIYTAMENKPVFEPYCRVEQDICLNLTAVNEFDSSGFQMLLLLEKEALTQNHEFSISQSSPAVQEVLSLYRKEHWLS